MPGHPTTGGIGVTGFDRIHHRLMGAGHGGPSGRYDMWREEASYLAFSLVIAGSA